MHPCGATAKKEKTEHRLMRDYKTKHVLSKDKRRRLLNLLASRHSHSEMSQWAVCKSCQGKFAKYKHEKAKLTEIEKAELYEDVKQKAVEISQKMIEQHIYPVINPYA